MQIHLVVISAIAILPLIIPQDVVVTPVKVQEEEFEVYVRGTGESEDSIHIPNLRGTQSSDGEVDYVSDFVIDPEDVVLVEEGENIVASATDDLKIHKLKVIDMEGQLIDLSLLSDTETGIGTDYVWSLQGLSPDVYLLVVIVGGSDPRILQAYETVLVILEPDQEPSSRIEYIEKTTTTITETDADIRIVFQIGLLPTPEPTPEPTPTSDETAPQGPDERCLFDPTLPHCASVNGECPEGFLMNENEQCFPEGGCPDGYHRIEDDESGRCYSDDEPCPPDMIKNPEFPKNCEYKTYVCETFPELEACQLEPTPEPTPEPILV